jgi:hypothetical protein
MLSCNEDSIDAGLLLLLSSVAPLARGPYSTLVFTPGTGNPTELNISGDCICRRRGRFWSRRRGGSPSTGAGASVVGPKE